MYEEKDNMTDDIKQSTDGLRSGVDHVRDGIKKRRNPSGNSGQTAASSGATAASDTGAAAAGGTASTTGEAAAATSGGAAGASGVTAAAGGTAAGAGASAAGSTIAASATAGTAAGGPAGTLVGAAAGVLVGLKDYVYLIIIGVAFVMMLLATITQALPGLVFNGIFSSDNVVDTAIVDNTQALQTATITLVDSAYSAKIAEIKALCLSNGYDWDISSSHITDNSGGSLNTDMAYLFCAYSVSRKNENATVDEYKNLLEQYSSNLYSFSYTVKEAVKEVPRTIPTYAPVSVYVPVYVVYNSSGETKLVGKRLVSVYAQSGTEDISVPTVRTVYSAEELSIVNSDDSVGSGTYYTTSGATETVNPDHITVQYMETIVNPISHSTINAMFDLDLDAWYFEPSDPSKPETGMTNRAMLTTQIENYLSILESEGFSLYGSSSGAVMQALTQEELEKLIASIPNCSGNRKLLLRNACSLAGRVPYFWGGRTAAGWDDSWGTPKVVTCEGDETTGMTFPWGLDCSGFVSWAYKTTFGSNPLSDTTTAGMGDGTYTRPITEEELLPGDLALNSHHVGIFVGYNEDGEKIYVHEFGYKRGCCISTYGEWTSYQRVVAVEDQLEGNDLTGSISIPDSFNSPLSYTLSDASWIDLVTAVPAGATVVKTINATVTFYDLTYESCGKYPDDPEYGITASGESIVVGDVAMSPDWPYGTQIGLFGKCFTCKDRGGAIDKDVEIDVYCPNTEMVKQWGKRKVTVPIYYIP